MSSKCTCPSEFGQRQARSLFWASGTSHVNANSWQRWINYFATPRSLEGTGKNSANIMAANNAVSHIQSRYKNRFILTNAPPQLDRVVGLAMLILASTVFLYYTIWTLLLVHPSPPINLVTRLTSTSLTPTAQPFVDKDHPLQSLFPPRVWAIRIPVILLLLGGAVVGSFLSVVMIQSNRKKAAKAAKAKGKKGQ